LKFINSLISKPNCFVAIIQINPC